MAGTIMAPKVYCDMDGVLADFNGGWKEFTGNEIDNWVVITGDDWKYLQKQWPTFWMDLELMPYAAQLWTALRPYDVEILTAYPNNGWKTAGVGKTIWARTVLGGNPVVHAVERREKKNYAKQKDGTPNILIDDMEKNIDEWEQAGGIGIQYIPSASIVQRVIREIESVMERYGA